MPKSLDSQVIGRFFLGDLMAILYTLFNLSICFACSILICGCTSKVLQNSVLHRHTSISYTKMLIP